METNKKKVVPMRKEGKSNKRADFNYGKKCKATLRFNQRNFFSPRYFIAFSTILTLFPLALQKKKILSLHLGEDGHKGALIEVINGYGHKHRDGGGIGCKAGDRIAGGCNRGWRECEGGQRRRRSNYFFHALNAKGENALLLLYSPCASLSSKFVPLPYLSLSLSPRTIWRAAT